MLLLIVPVICTVWIVIANTIIGTGTLLVKHEWAPHNFIVHNLGLCIFFLLYLSEADKDVATEGEPSENPLGNQRSHSLYY